MVHCLWKLGCWSYLHPSRGHISILMQLQRLDPIFNMGVDIMSPAFNLDPKYRVTMLTREEWTRGPGTPPDVEGLTQIVPGRWTGLGSMGNLWEESLVSF